MFIKKSIQFYAWLNYHQKIKWHINETWKQIESRHAQQSASDKIFTSPHHSLFLFFNKNLPSIY
ncbi:hypothetical protein BJJ97_10325 [Pectobacterium polaris]|nr:hypothetical protein BJJ97_10325 [Pectobacterium polaris]MCU1792958.1 hypothetical protein [Pectobacterium polaris]